MKLINYDYNGFKLLVEDENNLIEVLERLKLSKRFINFIFNSKTVLLNGIFQKKSSLVTRGDIVDIVFPDENLDYEVLDEELDIVYEDNQILVIIKPAFEAIHPTRSHSDKTTLNKVAYYFLKNGINRKIRFINRIDMETSGLVIIAKNQFVDQQISRQNEENKLIKKYIAVCSGVITHDYGIIEKPILDPSFGSTKKSIGSSGRFAKTEYWVKDRFQDSTLVEVRIHTGRSHQIRLHFESIGHPLIGDNMYGDSSAKLERQALHANYLAIENPYTKEVMKFEIELPKDMEKLIINESNRYS